MAAQKPFGIVPDLAECLVRLIEQVPAGRVTTCGDLAEALGNRIAALWVGHYSLHHDHTAECPCHRIVRKNGLLGPCIAGTIAAKSRLLAAEGVEVQADRVDLDRFGFQNFVTDRPLERLRQIQESIQRQIVVQPRHDLPEFTGGVDVAYPRPDLARAAYALVETASGRLVWSMTVERPVRFPYISTYLSFREIPIILDLLDEVRSAGKMAEVLMVDGSGILHQRHAGIASHLGVVASCATVGVTKKLLCGTVNSEQMSPGESRTVLYEGCPVGIALRMTAGSRRPIFISPGHQVDLVFAERLVRSLMIGRRLPAPIHWADRLSRRAG
jgi:deoxyribonuclease V